MSSLPQEFNVGSGNFRQVKHDKELVSGKKYLIKWRRADEGNDHHIAKFVGLDIFNNLLEFELWYTRTARMEERLPNRIWISAKRLGKTSKPLLEFPPSVFDDSVSIWKNEKPEVFDLGTFEGEISEPPPPPVTGTYEEKKAIEEAKKIAIEEAKKIAIVPPPPENSPRKPDEKEEEDYLDQGNPNDYNFSGGKRKSKKSKKNRRTSKKNRRTSKKGTKRSYKK
jgi:hypothetical protein